MNKINSCAICESTGPNFEFATIKDGYHILKCPFCGIYFVHPQPSEKDLEKIYSFGKGYFKHSDFNKNVISPYLEKCLKSLTKNTCKGKKFLDVGSGNGETVFFAEKMGYDALGLDINKGAVEKMQKEGINVINSTLESFNGERSSFDVVYLGNIIEHVKNPSEFLDKCNFLLKKGGKLLLATPNTNSFVSKYQLMLTKLFGIPWGHISPPHHLFEFSDKNLIKLLNSKKFKIEWIQFYTSSFSYSVGNTGLFKKFKREYGESRDFFKAWKKNKFKDNIMLGVVITLFSLGYLFDKFLGICYKGGNVMTALAVKK